MPLQEVDCPICLTHPPKKLKYPATFSGKQLEPSHFAPRNHLRKTHFQINECTECRLWISDPVIRGENLPSLYAEAEHHYESLERFISIPYERLIKKLCAKVKQRNCFLEVGGGNGFLFDLPIVQTFRERMELEPSKEREKDFQSRNSKGKFIRGVLAPETIPAGSVSAAAFFHVLDHLESPLEFLKMVFNGLEEGGGAVAVVHNTRALSARVLGKNSPILGVWHTFLYNPNNLKTLFQRAGFSFVKVEALRNTFPLWYWADHLPLGENIRKKQRTFLEKVRLEKLPITGYAGNLGVVAIK